MKTIIISLGGSLIVPEDIDVKFLKELKALILKQVRLGKRFIIITGGGKTCRKYQNAAKETGKITDEDLDWIGIQTTKLNAQLMRSIFNSQCQPEIAKDPTKKIAFTAKILVAGGWKPGFSTDMDAALLAKQFKASTIINLTNTDYVYDKDPKKFSDAKKIENITWKEFRKIVGSKWSPGLNAPFDPIASKLCQKNKIRVIIANGKNMKNVENIMLDKKFFGTIIS